MNRKLTAALTDLNFAPTNTAKENLLREGIDAEKNSSTKILTADKIVCENVKIPYNYKLEIVGNDLILTRS